MTSDTGLPGDAAEPARAAETTVSTEATTEPATEPAPLPAVPAFGEAFAALDPAAIEAEQAQRTAAAARRTRRRRNALRWLGATAVTLAVGGGTAFTLTAPQRTDIPGLGTRPDGRYDFPALTLPALPAGQPAPSASANSDAEQHLSDTRKLLLARPAGATPESTKSAVDGWLTDPSSLFVVRDSKSIFAEFGLRHTATESWRTGDGASTTIYLLQFADIQAASSAQTKLSDDDSTTDLTLSLSAALTGVPQDAASHEITPYVGVTGDYTPVKSGGELTRYGSFLSGDVIALVIQSGPANLPFAPFQQVMTLQAQLLQ